MNKNEYQKKFLKFLNSPAGQKAINKGSLEALSDSDPTGSTLDKINSHLANIDNNLSKIVKILNK